MFILTSVQHLTLSSRGNCLCLGSTPLSLDSAFSHWKTAECLCWQQNPKQHQAEQWNSPGLCAWPNIVVTANILLRGNQINKFVDDTTAVGLITGNNVMLYKQEGKTPIDWCKGNKLEVKKIKEMINQFQEVTVWAPLSVMSPRNILFLGVQTLGTRLCQL